jgi:hypothetical protein
MRQYAHGLALHTYFWRSECDLLPLSRYGRGGWGGGGGGHGGAAGEAQSLHSLFRLQGGVSGSTSFWPAPGAF